jgi:chloramphenicol 3-O phosphotransferase
VDVLVDDVVLDEAAWRDWCEALDGITPIWVAVRCAPDVVERREAQRADRVAGLARSQAGEVHRFPPYAIEVDTTELTVEQGVDELDRALAACWSNPSAPAGER